MKYGKVDVRLITKEEKEDAEDFQNVLRAFYDTFVKNKGRMGLDSFRDYQNLKKAVMRYHNRPWFERLKNFFSLTDRKFKDYFESRRSAQRVDKSAISNINNRALELFKQGNVNQIIQLSPHIARYTDAILKSFQNITYDIRNPLYIENPFIFQTTNFVKVFERPEMEALITKDLDEYRYTYLNMTEQRESNFQYMVYWIQELKNTDEPVELTPSKFEKFTHYQYDTPEFEKMLKQVDKYLYSGNRDALLNVISKINEFPTLHAANEKAKQQINKVYRGIGFYHDDENYASKTDIIKGEKERKFVATSRSFHAALNFAYMIGHLERDRRSDYGYMLTYEVGPESIILDTKIFGGKYEEDEVVIDATKAKLIDIKYTEKGNDGDENY